MTRTREDNVTLEAAWAAFWADARNMGADRTGLRQAFKNGAVFIVARSLTRGSDSALALAGNNLRATQEIIPWINRCLAAHPDWGEVHQHAVLAGGLSAVTLHYAGVPINIENFLP